MIPILYARDETAYTTNGLGLLAEAVDCQVEEERNGIYQLVIDYPLDGALAATIDYGLQILAKPNDTAQPQPFRIMEVSQPLTGHMTIVAEHIAGDTNGIPVFPFTASSCAAAVTGMVSNSAVENPFTFTTTKSSAGSFKVAVPTPFRELMGGVQGSILDCFGGGEYEFDRRVITLHQNRGRDNGVVLEYGHNLSGCVREVSITNTITGVAPYWADSEGNLVTLPEKVLQVEHSFPQPVVVPLDLSDEFEDRPTIAQLRAAAQARLTGSGNLTPKVNITVDFVPLWEMDEYKDHPAFPFLENMLRLSLCDTAIIRVPHLGIEVKEKVVRCVYDVLNERYLEMELGEPLSTATASITLQEQELAQKPSYDFMEKAIMLASHLLTGNKGGYVVFDPPYPAHPQRILIMDQPDKDKAQRVWQWNLSGLGYSRNGINGPYRLAITTSPGAIVADFITAGTLSANIIKAGILSDAAGKNTINMETGDVDMEGTFTSKNGVNHMRLGSGALNFYSNNILAAELRSYYNGSARLTLDSVQFGLPGATPSGYINAAAQGATASFYSVWFSLFGGYDVGWISIKGENGKTYRVLGRPSDGD